MTRKQKNQGMNWISQHKRLSIYLRDGLACVYCGHVNVKLTLDHIKPWSKNGSNEANNLVTSCLACNSMKADKSLTEFLKIICDVYDFKYADVYNHIQRCRRRQLDTVYAKELISRQGSCFKVLSLFKENNKTQF